MIDFKIGDRVEAVAYDVLYGIKPGMRGVVESIATDKTGMYVNIDGNICSVYFSTFKLVDDLPTYAPGTRIRGYVEGVVALGGKMIITDSVGDLAIAKLNDVTVIKTLPTKPGSLVSLQGNDYVLTQDNKDDVPGRSWKLVNGNGFRWLSAEEIGDSWTLLFDARA